MTKRAQLQHEGDMAWIEERPEDATQQLLEYASSGRLIDLDQHAIVDARDKAATVLVMILAATTVGVGATLVISAVRSRSTVEATVGFGLIAVGLSLLLPAVRLVRLHTATAGVEIRPGAVLPPDLVQAGNWIHRDGAWARVDEIGRDGTGTLTALLSTGEVIDLLTPITIAGGTFRPVTDPVAPLRR